MRPLALPLALLLLLPLSPAPRAAAEDKPAIAEALRLVASGDWKDRIQGLEMLESFPGDGRATRAAVRALADPDWGVILRAARTLGAVGGDEGRDPLSRLTVEGEIRWIRDAAAEALRRLDAPGNAARLLALARTLREPEQQVRALEAVSRMAGGESVKGATAMATGRDIAVSAAAVRVLGRAAASDPAVRREVVDILRRVLTVRGERKRFPLYAAAVEGLGLVATPETTALLVEEAVKAPDDDAYIQERIARGLAREGRTGAGAAVGEALAAEKNPALGRRLARLAARLASPDSRPGLLRALESPDERLRAEAARALGILGGEGAAEVRALLKDRSPFVRLEAVIALARLLPHAEFRALGAELAKEKEEVVRLQWVVEVSDRMDPLDLDALQPFFEDRAWRVASAAVATAGTLGAAGDLGRVQPLSSHRDWRIRAAAFEAMGRLRAKEAVPLLAAGLRDRDPVVKGVCHANLQILTRQDLPADAAAWAAWWEKNGSALSIVKRSRRDAAEIQLEIQERQRYGDSFYGKRGVEVLQKARILVVKGAWDKAELVLDHLKITHTLLRAQELKEAGLNPNQVVLVNCEGNLDGDSAERLQWFVNVGGYLMATDWALAKAVKICFPGYADHFPGANTGNDVVVVEDAAPGHRYNAGVFENVPAMKWWLEIQAFPLRILYPERVEILVDSAEMKTRYGSSPLAFTFRWGLGRVQHSVSHFYLQEEGMTQARGERPRMIFAADHLGLSIEQIREIAATGGFAGSLNEETMKKIAPDYSMFRLIVNFVAEKSRWVEDL